MSSGVDKSNARRIPRLREYIAKLEAVVDAARSHVNGVADGWNRLVEALGALDADACKEDSNAH